MFPAINFFNLIDIPLYGPVFIIGFFAALFIARKIGPSYGISKEDITFASVYGAIGLLIGAKLMYFLTKLPAIVVHFDSFLKLLKLSPLDALSYAFGGLVFYGGLIGAVVGVYRYCRHFKVPFSPFLDVFAPLIPMVHGIGRIGCFLAGCCYGIEYHGFGSVQFPYNELIPELSQVPRVPVQLMEAGMNFILSFVLFYLLKKKEMRTGQLMGIYIIYYSIVRCLLEMLRGDRLRGTVGIFSTSQLISFMILPVGIILLRGKWLSKKREEQVGNGQ